jgi:predicted DNA-binding ribbon-helix-helix protein
VRTPQNDTRDPARSDGRTRRPVKRSFTIGGHRTSISLEAPFWEALKEAAAYEKVPVSRLIARIDAGRKGCGLSSAVRVWLLAHRGGDAPTGE